MLSNKSLPNFEMTDIIKILIHILVARKAVKIVEID
jgi:hypothetical protein